MARGTDKDDAFYFPEEQLYAIPQNVPERYLDEWVAGKPYLVFQEPMNGDLYRVKTEDGHEIYPIRGNGSCAFLDGEAWTIVKESDLTPEQRRMAGLPTEDATIAELREQIDALEKGAEQALKSIDQRILLLAERVYKIEAPDVPKEQEWPQEGDLVWTIEGSGSPASMEWSCSNISGYQRGYQNFHGIYHTLEEADEVAAKVKRIMDHLRSGEVIWLWERRTGNQEKIEL